MSRLNMFIPIAKVDVEKRTVYGVATAEAEDLSGEICDYASTKPYFQDWSTKFADVTGGKSLGNLRAMHGKIAAGKLTAIDFDDAGKRITIAAKVVDDAEWAKVQEGVYTGFSQGGRYVKRWADESTGLTRYTAQPNEVSLVDMPCLPGATFEVVKAAGAVERVPFKTVIEDPTPDAIKVKAEDMAKAAPGKTWRDFADAAFNDLAKAAMATAALAQNAPGEGDNPDAEIDDGSSKMDDDSQMTDAEVEAAGNRVDTRPPEGPRPGETSRKVYEPKQVWRAGPEGPYFERKAEAVKHMKAEEDSAAAKAAASPLSAALAKAEAALGIEKGAAPDPLAAAIEALFPSVAKRTFSAEQRKAAAKSGSAMSDGSFPIENKEDLSNAIQAYGRAKDKPKAKAHIEARAKALGAENMLPDSWTKGEKAMADDGLAKGLYAVGNFAQIIDSLSYLYCGALWEKEYEGDSSTVPDDLCHSIRALGEILLRMAAEEVGELMPDGAEPTLEQGDAMALGAGLSEAAADALGKLAGSGPQFAILAKFKAQLAPIEKLFGDLEKKGARNSKSDKTRIQGIHDHAMALGAGCSAGNVGKDGVVDGDLAKAVTENQALKDELAKAAIRIDTIVQTFEKRIANLEAQPAPAKAVITVTKGFDGATGNDGMAGGGDAQAEVRKFLDSLSPQERASFLMKVALSNPVPVIK